MSNRISPEKQKRIDYENQFINFEFIDLTSKMILDELEVWANENIYKLIGGTLTVDRPMSDSVNACAIVDPSRPLNAMIKINMGMIREIYRDSFIFPTFCEKFANDSPNIKQLNEEFNNLGFTFDAGLPYIPVEKRNEFYHMIKGVFVGKGKHFTEDATTSRCMYFEVALAWVFFHELSHLVQCHYRLRNQLASENNLIEFYEIREASESSEENSYDQAREVLADMEGIELTLKYMIQKDIFTSGSLYIFMCALGCMFNRFYNGYDEKITIGNSTHPHPIVRNEFSTAYIANAASQKLVEMKYAENHESVAVAIVYLSVRASLLSGIFWGWRYEDQGDGTLTSFMKYSSNHNVEQRKACCSSIEEAMNKQLITIAGNHLMKDNFLSSLAKMESFFDRPGANKES
jgi:hypothetical protein